jgi:hypothetical protein
LLRKRDRAGEFLTAQTKNFKSMKFIESKLRKKGKLEGKLSTLDVFTVMGAVYKRGNKVN